MYRALYRKWRPQRFEDVVAQSGTVAALKNQVASGRVGHAYLFTGVRGTGKTTCAKIFARAVNCMDPHDGDPCGVCPACRGIENGSILDVVEMDAASNNGVDDIRDIRDETAYTPSMCKYKVYIIDEVHMLSGAAFNALLKTLEEPPAHVIFILATTEIQKVPATILSRCQRYDFTRIMPDDIAGRVAEVAQSEGLTLTADAAALIARLADGAMRDALSILDTCAGVSTEINAEIVRRMAGVTDKSYLFALSDAIAAKDGVAALAKLSELRQKSVDVKRLSEELIGHYRNLMLAALPGGKALLAGVSPDEEAAYLQKASEIGQAEAIRAIRVLGAALEKMTRGNDQRIELELAIFHLTEPPLTAQVQAVQVVQPTAGTVARPFAAAQAPAVQPFAAAAVPVQAAPAQPAQQPKPEPVAAPAADRTPPAAEEELPPPPEENEMPPAPWEEQPLAPRTVPEKPRPAAAQPVAAPQPALQGSAAAPEPFALWEQVVKKISELDPMLSSYLRRSKGYFDGKRVLIDGGPMFNDFLRENKDSQKLIKKVLAQVSGQSYPIGPYSARKATQKAQVSAEDSMASLAAMGVEVVVKDSKNSRS